MITILRDLTAFPFASRRCAFRREKSCCYDIYVYVCGEYEMLITLIPEVLGFRYFALKPFYIPQRVSLAATVPVSRDAENRNEGDHGQEGEAGRVSQRSNTQM